jgi:hypothetical protein
VAHPYARGWSLVSAFCFLLSASCRLLSAAWVQGAPNGAPLFDTASKSSIAILRTGRKNGDFDNFKTPATMPMLLSTNFSVRCWLGERS